MPNSTFNIKHSTLNFIFRSLLLNIGSIAEVVDTHSLANLVHGLGCKLASILATLLQDVEYFRNILLKLMTAGTDWV